MDINIRSTFWADPETFLFHWFIQVVEALLWCEKFKQTEKHLKVVAVQFTHCLLYGAEAGELFGHEWVQRLVETLFVAMGQSLYQ